MCDVHEEEYFNEKKKKQCLQMGLTQWVGVEKTVYKSSKVKKKFKVQQSVKVVMLTVSKSIKRLITIDLFEKVATVNNTSI